MTATELIQQLDKLWAISDDGSWGLVESVEATLLQIIAGLQAYLEEQPALT